MAKADDFGYETLRKDFSDLLRCHVSDAEGRIDELKKQYDDVRCKPEDKRLAMDQAFRDVLLSNQDISDEQCISLLNFSFRCVEYEMCASLTPLQLFIDVFDIRTIDKCEVFFDLVESRIALWRQEPKIRTSLLRMCNDLLRRLSRSQNTVFCGRILVFMAKTFPLDERSGLNLLSEFNIENQTMFASEEEYKMATNSDAEKTVKSPSKATANHSAITVDYNLYRKFWSLQDIFMKPNSLAHRANWKTFTQFSIDVLSSFSSFKLTDMQGPDADPAMPGTSHDSGSRGAVYFAKYLTSHNLLELQLSDSNFRRYILIQFLILFQYLQTNAKSKGESLTLNDEQHGWLKSTSERIYQLIRETPPNGEKFSSTVQLLLKREEYWNQWKNDNCPAIGQKTVEDKLNTQTGTGSNTASSSVPIRSVSVSVAGVDSAAVKPNPVRPRKRLLGEEIRVCVANKKFTLGNSELTRIWNFCPDNMAACRSDKRNFLPDLKSFIEPTLEQADPANGIEDEYKLVNNPAWSWKALRLLSRGTPHFFAPANPVERKMNVFLANVINKMAPDVGLKPYVPPPPDIDSSNYVVIDSVGGGKLQSAEEGGGREGGGDSAQGDSTDMARVTDDVSDEEDELLKGSGNEQDNHAEDDKENGEITPDIVTSEHIDIVVENLKTDWSVLASELGFDLDETGKMEVQCKGKSVKDLTRFLLVSWLERDGDGATVPNLLVALKAADMADIANALTAVN